MGKVLRRNKCDAPYELSGDAFPVRRQKQCFIFTPAYVELLFHRLEIAGEITVHGCRQHLECRILVCPQSHDLIRVLVPLRKFVSFDNAGVADRRKHTPRHTPLFVEGDFSPDDEIMLHDVQALGLDEIRGKGFRLIHSALNRGSKRLHIHHEVCGGRLGGAFPPEGKGLFP